MSTTTKPSTGSSATGTYDCPMCRSGMKRLPSGLKFDFNVEGMKKYSTPSYFRVCPSCGNMQQFMDVEEIRPLLE
jgi:hypothetical protein